MITGELAAIKEIVADPTKSAGAINDALGKLTGKKLSDAVIASSFKNIKVTDDPLASTYNTSSQHAVDGGLLKSVPDLNGHLRPAHSQQVAQGSRPRRRSAPLVSDRSSRDDPC